MASDSYPDPGGYDSLVDLLDDSASRYPADRPILSLRTDDGITVAWSAAELRHRARTAAWRLHLRGLAGGDRRGKEHPAQNDTSHMVL